MDIHHFTAILIVKFLRDVVCSIPGFILYKFALLIWRLFRWAVSGGNTRVFPLMTSEDSTKEKQRIFWSIGVLFWLMLFSGMFLPFYLERYFLIFAGSFGDSGGASNALLYPVWLQLVIGIAGYSVLQKLRDHSKLSLGIWTCLCLGASFLIFVCIPIGSLLTYQSTGMSVFGEKLLHAQRGMFIIITTLFAGVYAFLPFRYLSKPYKVLILVLSASYVYMVYDLYVKTLSAVRIINYRTERALTLLPWKILGRINNFFWVFGIVILLAVLFRLKSKGRPFRGLKTHDK